MTTRGLKDMKEEWAGCVSTAYRVLYDEMTHNNILPETKQYLMRFIRDLEKACKQYGHYSALYAVCSRNGYLGVEPDNKIIMAE